MAVSDWFSTKIGGGCEFVGRASENQGFNEVLLLLDFLGQAMHTQGNAVKLTVLPIAGAVGNRRSPEI